MYTTCAQTSYKNMTIPTQKLTDLFIHFLEHELHPHIPTTINNTTSYLRALNNSFIGFSTYPHC